MTPAALQRKDSIADITNSNSMPVKYHVIFWVGYFVLNFVRWGHYFGDYQYSFNSNLVEFPIHVILVYFNLYFLVPKLIPAKMVRYIIFILLATFALSMLRIVITYELVTTEIWRESIIEQTELFNINYILAVFIGELYVVGLTMAIKLTYDWIKYQRLTKELMQQNHDTQLSFLRSQMQPHFFFNTLNNLYSLTLDKSDQAPETVLKLSDLMSYVVYKGKKPQVNLMQEIQHLQNYLDLERLRYGDKIDVSFDIEGNIDDKILPPLILIPFVENAFKHGAIGANGKFHVDISLKAEEGSLTFKVENDKADRHHNDHTFQPERTSGIGLKNTRKRLDLLYPENYKLEIEDNGEKYKVNLNIPV